MLKSLFASLFRKAPAAAPAPDAIEPGIEAQLATAVRLQQSGDFEGADRLYLRILELQPAHAHATHLRGLVALQQGAFMRALPLLRRASEQVPGNATYLNHLGEALRQCDELDEAIRCLESAVAIDPRNAPAWNNLGAAHMRLGFAQRALECYRKAVALAPRNRTMHANLLFALNLIPDVGHEERYREHLRWAERHADPLAPASPARAAATGERKLRVGYLSGAFREHALVPFIAALFERHDRARFEVFAYSNVARPDAVTESLRARVDHWRDIVALDDEAATARIRDDGIDILVDLDGHTSGNRLLVFARRAAPVQVTMLGYPFSTGMAAMDFRVTDRIADAPPAAQACNRERLLYLPDSLWCFRPWPQMPDVTPLPAAARGHVTFVSLNSRYKLNDAVLETWARILQRVPGARLQFMSIQQGRARDELVARLAALGVDDGRINTFAQAPYAEFWRHAQSGDIALDAFPYNGGATTCETLWLGLPVVALKGEHFVARASWSILRAAGLEDLACESKDAYVERACALAADPAALAELRSGLRDRLRASALLDEAKYVAALETLFEDALRAASTPEHAEEAFRSAGEARESGEWARAIEAYRRVLAAEPGHAQAHNDLGIAFCAIGDFAAAREAYARAIDLQPDLVPAHVNLGQVLYAEFRDYGAAATHFRAALALEPSHEPARINLGLALYECGQTEDAVACMREAFERAPGDPQPHQYLLFMSNALAGRDHDEWFALHRLWGERHADGVARFSHPPASPKDRLRVGYLSADFREHATAGFIRGILAGHDRAQFEIVCYSSSGSADAVTALMQRDVQTWRDIQPLADAEAADLVRADGIDILVDLAGHTRGARPGVLARKPAPLQLSYLGYLNTSGMAAIDYRITDAVMDPPGSEQFHTEALLRLPHVLWCYRAPDDAPATASLPALRSGSITFGSFNHVAKLNPHVLAAWAQLLRRLPGARLKIIAVPDDEAAARIRSAMQREGIDPARIETRGRLARSEYWRAMSEVDIALDPFPYTGGATTCDCLWMGLPVVTLAGRFGFARTAASVLSSVGLEELVCADEQRYIGTAARLAADGAALAQLREGMRERLRGSPLMDCHGFIAALEKAYRDAWRALVVRDRDGRAVPG